MYEFIPLYEVEYVAIYEYNYVVSLKIMVLVTLIETIVTRVTSEESRGISETPLRECEFAKAAASPLGMQTSWKPSILQCAALSYTPLASGSIQLGARCRLVCMLPASLYVCTSRHELKRNAQAILKLLIVPVRSFIT